MFSIRSWLTSSKADAVAKVHGVPSAEELEDALCCLNYVLDDNIVQAEAELSNGSSCYHHLGRALTIVLMGSLEMEHDTMHKSSSLMAAAETLSASNYTQCQREPGENAVSIYPHGTEFILCNAQAKLSAAIFAILNQNLTDCIKAFYKMRKVYLTLESIMEAENAFMQNMARTSASKPMALDLLPAELSQDLNDIQFQMSQIDLNSYDLKSKFSKEVILLQHNPESNVFASGIDVYIHSGTNFSFGLIQLALSMVPAVFKQPLKIIGFRGNKEAGLKMLWQATKFANIQGALAAIALLTYYNSSRVVCDILDIEAYPRKACADLVNLMTSRYPNSSIWRLEQARVALAKCELRLAIDILSPPTRSPMKQLEVACTLEKSLYSMFLHDYEMCSDGYILSGMANKYSKAFHFYTAGAAQVELYRRAVIGYRRDLAVMYKQRAEEWLREAAKQVDKRGLLSQQLPFDAYVERKIKKWKKRADDQNIHLVDAIGVSPIEEIIYVYGGYKRMKTDQLNDSLRALSWSSQSPRWKDEASDERAIHALLTAVIYRTDGDVQRSREILTTEILAHDRRKFMGASGKLSDNWPCPCAHYEMAIICWMERTEQNPASKVAECLHYLDEVSKWEKFDLDSRIALKVSVTRELLSDFIMKPTLT